MKIGLELDVAINIEIPLTKDLAILQREQYWPNRYIKKKIEKPFDLISKEGNLVESYKAKAYLLMYVISLAVCYFVMVISLDVWVAVGVFVLVNIWPVILLLPISLFVKFLERQVLSLLAIKKSKKIKVYEKMEVVGIAGSFGKSVVKNILTKILSSKGVAEKTDEGNNTLMDISRTIDKKISKKTRYFVVEMGAFARGDIKQILKMIEVDWAIISNIGNQHIERLGSIENVFRANFEIIDKMRDKKRCLINWDDKEIRKQVNDNPKYRQLSKMSFEDKKADFFVNKIKMSVKKSLFWIKHRGRNYKFEINSFGLQNIENTTMAICMAINMGVKIKKIRGVVKNIKMEGGVKIRRVGKSNLAEYELNNELAYQKMIEDLKKMKGGKCLVTGGVDKMGQETKSTHQILGKLAGDVFDEIVLVGESDMTRSLQVGIGRSKTKTKVWFLEDKQTEEKTIEKMSKKYKWVVKQY